MIPKIIHYCWLSNDPIPDVLLKYMNSWKEHLPDYDFMLWNFDRFDINSSIWVKEAFENRKYAFAADYIRLYAVYHYGGIYLDMDVEVIKSFDSLLNNKSILGWETQKGIEGGIFGAEKEAVWLRDCLYYYNGRSFILPNGDMDMRPLPQIMFDILYEKYISTGILTLLSPDFLTSKSYETGEIIRTENTYTIHHFAASWHGRKHKIYKVFKNIFGVRTACILSTFYKKLRFYSKKIVF